MATKNKTTNKKSMTKLNETGRRKATEDRRKKNEPVAKERRKVQRRRQIDPTTCERDYSDCEIEFMQALDEYKRKNGRMFPTCSEILEVLLALGYRKTAEASALPSSEQKEAADDSKLPEDFLEE